MEAAARGTEGTTNANNTIDTTKHVDSYSLLHYDQAQVLFKVHNASNYNIIIIIRIRVQGDAISSY